MNTKKFNGATLTEAEVKNELLPELSGLIDKLFGDVEERPTRQQYNDMMARHDYLMEVLSIWEEVNCKEEEEVELSDSRYNAVEEEVLIQRVSYT